jgi:hypothetical protein
VPGFGVDSVKLGLCARCRRLMRIKARRLCNTCSFWAYANRTHIDFPRVNRSTEELMADYHLLRSEGHTDRQIAERLGMKLGSLRRALQRARSREAV